MPLPEPRLFAVEIETSTHCNWRCVFCPVSIAPKPKRSMPIDLFQQIVDKAAAHPTVQFVTFNSYNEPTIDPGFAERVRRLAKTRLRLTLHTNGSGLDAAAIALLTTTRVASRIVFNLPALAEADFRALTGTSALARTVEAIDRAVAAGLPVGLSIQGTAQERRAHLPAIRERYGTLVEQCGPAEVGVVTSDRAGFLRNRYRRDVQASGPLRGCSMPLTWLHVGVNGDCFACCEDYRQQEIFGNIRDGSIDQLLRTPAAERLLRRVFGAEDAPEDFLCRRCWVMARTPAQRPDSSSSSGPSCSNEP